MKYAAVLGDPKSEFEREYPQGSLFPMDPGGFFRDVCGVRHAAREIDSTDHKYCAYAVLGF